MQLGGGVCIPQRSAQADSNTILTVLQVALTTRFKPGGGHTGFGIVLCERQVVRPKRGGIGVDACFRRGAPFFSLGIWNTGRFEERDLPLGVAESVSMVWKAGSVLGVFVTSGSPPDPQF